MDNGALGFLPLWALFLATVGVVLLSVMLGFRAGRAKRRTSETGDQGPVGTIVGATFALVAFVVVLSYGTAASNFETRRQLVVDEASTIESSYQIAKLLPEPQSTEIRNILREYVTVKVSGFQLGDLQRAIPRSEQLQGQLWSEVADIERNHPNMFINSIFVQSLRQLVDIHTKRTAMIAQHVLPFVWITLYFVTMMAMLAFGYQSGLTGKYHILAILTLVLAFSAALWLLADFDRPLSGTNTVSPQPMIDLMQELNAK